MDSFELNKIIGAILGTLLFVMGAGFLAEAIYHPIEGRGPGYELPEAAAEGGTEVAEAAPEVGIGTLLASANIDQGAQAVAKCKGCHNFEEGAANKQGPGLYGVVERLIGSHEGFAYSEAFMELNAAGETWTYQHLNDFLTAPKSFADTKMNFGGLKNPEERANVIAYLSTLSANPVPFPPPEPEPGATADAAAPAGTEAAPAGTEAVPVEEDTQAVETPTVTQDESPVEGTPVTTTAPATEPAAPAEPATATEPTQPAPATTEAPAATETPAGTAAPQ